jgi:hypothetical protein
MKMHENIAPGSTVSKIQALLGPCVLIECAGKTPLRKKWTQLEITDMTPDHLARLTGNIGVVLGPASNGLVVIDIDNDFALQDFLKSNPWAENTLRTRGNRGASLWVRLPEDVIIPKSCKLTSASGEATGEWRAEGNQSIIYGIHPASEKPYQYLVETSPTLIQLDQIQWPTSLMPQKRAVETPRHDLFDLKAEPKNPQSKPTLLSNLIIDTATECDVEVVDQAENIVNSAATIQHSYLHSSASIHYSASLHHNQVHPLAMMALRAEKEFKAKCSTGVAKLYRFYVEQRFPAKREARNAFITQAVPFLFHVMDIELILEFSLHFFRQNQAIFKDSIEQHEKESLAAIKGVTETYLQGLSPNKRELYLELPSPDQTTFRISNDLAKSTTNKEFPPPLFFLSSADLGHRTGRSCQQANRSLQSLCRLNVIEVHELGVQRAKNQKGKATTYRWLID